MVPQRSFNQGSLHKWRPLTFYLQLNLKSQIEEVKLKSVWALSTLSLTESDFRDSAATGNASGCCCMHSSLIAQYQPPTHSVTPAVFHSLVTPPLHCWLFSVWSSPSVSWDNVPGVTNDHWATLHCNGHQSPAPMLVSPASGQDWPAAALCRASLGSVDSRHSPRPAYRRSSHNTRMMKMLIKTPQSEVLCLHLVKHNKPVQTDMLCCQHNLPKILYKGGVTDGLLGVMWRMCQFNNGQNLTLEWVSLERSWNAISGWLLSNLSTFGRIWLTNNNITLRGPIQQQSISVSQC